MDRVKGKIAVVTGGASGIGRATAILMARESAKVAIADIDEDGGKEVVGQIKKSGGQADSCQKDAQKSSQKAEEKRYASGFHDAFPAHIITDNGRKGHIQGIDSQGSEASVLKKEGLRCQGYHEGAECLPAQKHTE